MLFEFGLEEMKIIDKYARHTNTFGKVNISSKDPITFFFPIIRYFFGGRRNWDVVRSSERLKDSCDSSLEPKPWQCVHSCSLVPRTHMAQSGKPLKQCGLEVTYRKLTLV